MSATATNDAPAAAVRGPSTRGRRLRAWARARARFWPLVLLVPALLVVLADLTLRGERVLGFPIKYVGSYSAAFVESAVLWGVLLYAASARRGRLRWLAAAAFVALAGMLTLAIRNARNERIEEMEDAHG